ncbi:unnamed protein product [Symbiodinium necroappetens]|uniref:Uncharacterized protein n=1 Tax=Symbiodinium necroappetens TaxID=1628268 RepID=A0A812NP15_9DINO|nr:unnamed protein product [Symbiodinium necroappetens]
MSSIQQVEGTNLHFYQDCGESPVFKGIFCKKHLPPPPLARARGKRLAAEQVRVSKRLCFAAEPATLLQAHCAGAAIATPPPLQLAVAMRATSQAAYRQRGGIADIDTDACGDFVTCRTSKMPRRLNRRSGGWLLACTSDGMVTSLMEFLGGLNKVADSPEHGPEYAFNLPDGVASRFRYTVEDGVPWAQFRVPNRDIEDHAELSVRAGAVRVVERFTAPHEVLAFDQSGRGAFLAYQTLLSVRANAAAQVGSDALATRMSIAPWHLGILSALMYVFDVFVGSCGAPVAAAVLISEQHVCRAWALLQLLLQIRSVWGKQEEEGVKPCSVKVPPRDFHAMVGKHCSLPTEPMAAFPATQPYHEKPPIPTEKDAVKQLLTGKDFDDFLKKGYGAYGASAQSVQSFLTDREIMRRTVLRGKPKVTYKDLSLRKNEKTADGKKKLSVPKETWIQVMRAGLAEHPIGKITADANPVVEFSSIPPDEAPRVAFHNFLVDLCNVSVRQFAETLAATSSRPKKRAKQEEASECEEDDEADT